MESFAYRNKEAAICLGFAAYSITMFSKPRSERTDVGGHNIAAIGTAQSGEPHNGSTAVDGESASSPPSLQLNR
jgi:hypothetical protein